MISKIKALALKEAGLTWTPENGDFFATDATERANIFVISGSHYLHESLGGKMWFYYGHLCVRDDGCRANETATECLQKEETSTPTIIKDQTISSYQKQLWFPRLDQLLNRAEKGGFVITIQPIFKGKNNGLMFKAKIIDINTKKPIVQLNELSPKREDAAADALIWLLTNQQMYFSFVEGTPGEEAVGLDNVPY